MTPINKIVIHCSDTPDSGDFRADDIHRWHKSKGWDGIGYHYIVCRDGEIERGRPHYWSGAHVKGHNTGSLGICMIGRTKFTDEQWRSLHDLVLELCERYNTLDVYGHYQLDSGKTCPNFDVPEWFKVIKTLLAKRFS